MPLFETIPINHDEVRQIVHKHWDIALGKCLKESQNHTFLAESSSGQKFIVRVTPDPENKREKSTQLELKLLDYLTANKYVISVLFFCLKSRFTPSSPFC